jgi:two-component system chemotaxis response regulator CheY
MNDKPFSQRRNLRVMVIDNNPLIARVLQSILKAQGFTVSGVEHSGAAAIRLIAANPPAVACVDMDISSPDSLSLVSHIHANHPEVYAVMLATDTRRQKIVGALEAGAIGYVEKPLTAGHILDVLDPLAGLLAPEALPDGDGATVLVVDRNRQMRALLTHMLRSLGYRVIGEAASGMEGLILLEQHRPDVICMAIDTPDVRGLDALIAIKACHPEVAVVFVTAHAERETVNAAIQRGANGYILKPFSLDNVRNGLQQAQITSERASRQATEPPSLVASTTQTRSSNP